MRTSSSLVTHFSVVLASMVGCLSALALALPVNAGAAGCPNEAFKIGPSALLPGCRAYEMVSPPDKNRGNVSAAFSVFASPDGENVNFSSINAFADTPSSVLGNAYIARRGGANWGTESVNPPFSNPDGGPFTYLSPVSSPDMTKTLQFNTAALTPGAISDGSNVYIHNNITGALQLVVALPGRNFFNAIAVYENFFVTGNSNWSHILLQSTFPLTGETTEGVRHLYDYSDGRLTLLDRLPDESIPAGGTEGVSTNTPNTNVMSADGSRVFFDAAPTEGAAAAVFMRETRNGQATTVPISTVQKPGPEKGEVVAGAFGGASADGSVVYFTSNQPLTPNAGTATPGQSLYRYDVESEALTDVTPTANPEGPQVGAVLGVSEDGSYVYFGAHGKLTGKGSEDSSATNFYVVHEGGSPELIGSTEPNIGEATNPREWITSPSGRYFAFASLSPLNEEVIPGTEASCPSDFFTIGNNAGVCLQVFRYDAVASHLECVSCDGQVPAGPSYLGGFFRSRREALGTSAPHAMLNDGTVYFDTKNALLPSDVNEVKDVYADRAGTPELISTGIDAHPSNFGDATSTGSNVYFSTAGQLVKLDTDSSIDVYDDREGGGLSDQWPPGQVAGCVGEGCRSAAPTAPMPVAPGSAGSRNGCEALLVRAHETASRAKSAADRARQASRGEGAADKARAHRLRHRSQVQKLKAKRAAKRAKSCGRQGK